MSRRKAARKEVIESNATSGTTRKNNRQHQRTERQANEANAPPRSDRLPQPVPRKWQIIVSLMGVLVWLGFLGYLAYRG